MPSDGTSILLIEDNPDDVFMIKRAFTKAQIATPVVVVGDGEEAVAYLEGTGAYADRAQYPVPALILLDLKLPRRSGIEVLTWMRGVQQLHGLPVVVLTSSEQQADIAAAYKAGANSYLVKPIDLARLENVVRHLDLYWMRLNIRPATPRC